jgi:hypothetical protein
MPQTVKVQLRQEKCNLAIIPGVMLWPLDVISNQSFHSTHSTFLWQMGAEHKMKHADR